MNYKNKIGFNDRLDYIIKNIVENKLSFGMDIDDVIIHFKDYFRQGINKYFNTELKEEDIVTYNVSKLLPIKNKDITKKEVYSMLRTIGNNEEFTKLPANKGVRETIDLLINSSSENGYHNFFINTSRGDDIYEHVVEKTIKNLKYNNLRFYKHNVIFDDEKDYVAKSLGLKLFFEDNLENALKIIKKNIPVIMPTHEWNIKTPRDIILLSKEDAEYKHNLIDEIETYSGEYFFRIKNFEEFLEYINLILKIY